MHLNREICIFKCIKQEERLKNWWYTHFSQEIRNVKQQTKERKNKDKGKIVQEKYKATH